MTTTMEGRQMECGSGREGRTVRHRHGQCMCHGRRGEHFACQGQNRGCSSEKGRGSGKRCHRHTEGTRQACSQECE